MTATESRIRFMRLQIERIDARELGVDEGCAYMANLSAAIADAKSDYIASAVMEIASMIADLGEPTAQDLTVFSN